MVNDGPLKFGAGKQLQHLAENTGYSCHGGARPPYGSRLSTQTVAEFYCRRSKANLDKSESISSIKSRSLRTEYNICSSCARKEGLRRVASRPVRLPEHLQDQPARTQFGRALAQLDIDGTHWLVFRGRYLPLRPSPAAPRSASPGIVHF